MDYLRAIRIGRGVRNLSQKELARKAGLDPSYISLMERGKRRVSDAVFLQLCDAMELPHDVMRLLAADADSLRGITTEEAATLGRLLLDLSNMPGSELSPVST